MDKETLLECIKNEKFDDAKKIAFQLIQMDDTSSIQWALSEASDFKETLTYKIVEKMLKYI